jgi:N-succinyldiaminopimelate aminotransferase
MHGIPETIFARMSALAVSTGSINLGQGFPDEDGPQEIVEAAVSALRDGRNQDAPGIGIPALRHAIAAHQRRHYGLVVDPDEGVIVSAGATEALAASILAFTDPGDEVVVLEPYYDSYTACIEMAGGVRRPVTLRPPDFRLDADALRAAVSPRTRYLLINSPHNPTGAVLDRTELEAVAAVAQEHDLIVVTDEVYEHLTFDTARHIPLASLPGMFDRTVTISSAGKSFSFTGWNVGWVSGPPDLVRTVLGAKQWLTYSNASALQPAIAHALDHHDDYPTRLARDLQRRRNLLVSGLNEIGLPTFSPEGTYFAMSDVSTTAYPQSGEFCERLPEIAGVVAIPASVFYDDADAGRHLVRWAFCKREDVLHEALDRLREADLGL